MSTWNLSQEQWWSKWAILRDHLRELLKIHRPTLHPTPLKLESLGVGSRYQYFLKLSLRTTALEYLTVELSK